MQLLKVLPSKILQIDGPNALCEDGSVWTYVETGRQWAEVHPPHKPPTQAADLAETLEVLRMLAEYACFDYGKNHAQCLEAFNRAWETLKKHGA